MRSNKIVSNEVKTIKCYLSHLMEKAKQTFWPVQYYVINYHKTSRLKTTTFLFTPNS